MMKRIYLFLLILFGISFPSWPGVPNVVVTVKPIFSLVSGVMCGLKQPILLMSGNTSPHTQLLTPNEVRQINAADVVVWVGPPYESSLKGIMTDPKKNQLFITLVDQPGMIIYPVRQGGLWGNHSHCSENSTCEHHNQHSEFDHNQSIDGHLWVEPENAKVIVRTIAHELAKLDPAHEEHFKMNAEKVINRLQALDEELKELLIPVINKPYIVYHDGMQYFDRHFHTKAIGVLIGDGHFGVNAKHLLEISQYIKIQHINCVFTEPQFPTDKIHSLMDKTETKIEILDYIGVSLEADENAYFTMMRNLANSLLRGLGNES